jgi:hypothetical protein
VSAELVEYLARRLVDEPDAVRVEELERDGDTILQLHVAKDDVGKVIGRQGRSPARFARWCGPRPPAAAAGRCSRSSNRHVMRVAALYDIHGNLPALEAVLAEVEREGVDAIVIGGDIASGPPQPREVVELVRSLPNAHCIRGNADRLFDEEFAADEGLGWLLERLDDELARWLASLPSSVVLDDTLYCPRDAGRRHDDRHRADDRREAGRPAARRRAVRAWSRVTRTCSSSGAWGRSSSSTPGSVGWPYEGIPGSYWAILDEGVALRHTTTTASGRPSSSALRPSARGRCRGEKHPRLGDA